MRLRQFDFADIDAVNRLHREVWWPERSVDGWKWLNQNPAREDVDVPAGLIVDGPDGQPAAFLGVFTQRFWQGNSLHHGLTGFSVIVPPAVRGSTRLLLPAFHSIPGHAAYYTLNANALSSPIYRRYGMQAWPPKTHDVKLAWIINPLACALSRGLRTLMDRRPGLADQMGEQLMPVGGKGALDHKRLPRAIEAVQDRSPGSAYDRFWTALKAEGRFIADRSGEVLNWRLSDPDLTLPIIHIARMKGGEIQGHALAVMAKYSTIEPPTLEILDLEALKDHRDTLAELTRALIQLAPSLGAAKVRLQVVSPQVLSDLGKLGERARREGGYGHCHVRFAAGSTGHETWSPTPFDGDYSFCLRPLPRP